MSPFFGGNVTSYVILYSIIASIIIYFGISVISKFEFWGLVLLLFSIFIIFIKEFSHLQLDHIFFTTPLHLSDWKTIFLPYGAIMFSLWGINSIPQIEEMLIGRKKLLKRIIMVSVIIPAVFYLLFIFLILGISGSQTTESALTGLNHFLGQGVFLLAIFVGFLATFTAFISQGFLLKKTFTFDCKTNELVAWTLTCFVPPILFMLGFNSFIPLISLIGGLLLGINGILILLMYQKIGGKKIVIYPLSLVFILGIIYEVVYIIK